MSCAAAQHGTAYAARFHGCQCEEAILDRRRECNEYRKKRYLNGGEKLRIPNVGALRRKQALARMGWTEDEVARVMGSPAPRPRQNSHLRNVHVETHQWWVAAFNRLAHLEGPSRRVMAVAVTKGWPPPLAWFDIDDPDEEPGVRPEIRQQTVERRKQAARARRAKRIRTLKAAGYPVPERGAIPTVTQYRRELEAKRVAQRNYRAEQKRDYQARQKGEAA